MELSDKIKELELYLKESFNKYAALHEELNAYKNRPLEQDEVPEVNRILQDIQLQFSNKLYPIYHFIGLYYQSSVNATNEHTNFIESIKKSGATQNKPEEALPNNQEDAAKEV